MEINPILTGGISGLQGPEPRRKTEEASQGGPSFSQMLAGLNQSQQTADELATRLSLGENVELHQVMIAMEETDVQFRVALAIRDKLVEAYREVMRMQV